MNDITFTKGSGGLGRPLSGEDHICGIVFYNATLPSGFSSSARIKQIFSIEEAEDLGIVEGSAAHDVEFYHIAEFFRINPKGVLYVGYFDVPVGAHDFAEVTTMQVYAEGKIRQVGVFTEKAFVSTMLTAAQVIATANATANMPLQILLVADISGTADLSTLADLRTLTAPNVSMIIGQDGAADGAALYVTSTKTVGILGAVLGAVSMAKVSECIGWAGKFLMSETELDVAAFGNGKLLKEVSTGLVDGLDDKGYIFIRKIVGASGTYLNDSHTAVAITSDYATIENNRTIDKAIRQTRTNLIPDIARPILVNKNGTLTEDIIAYFKSKAESGLEQMKRDGELSDYAVVINPAQLVLQTSKLEITLKLIPVGVARNIDVKIGFTVKIG